MNKPASLHDRSKYPESDIFEIRRAAPVLVFPKTADVPRMPYAAGPATPELLARMALDHVLANEHTLARQAAEDALLIIESLADSQQQSDRANAASAALTAGEALLLLHEAHRAQATFELAARFFDSQDTHHDRSRSAQARVGLAKALLALHDPSARAALEDAGELFEELGDHEAVLTIDLALRQAAAELDESPRSFHAAGARPALRRLL